MSRRDARLSVCEIHVTSAAPPDLHYITYEDYLSGVRAIMAAVRANAWLPDFVVGVGRGGLAPAVFISHGLSVPMLSVRSEEHTSELQSLMRISYAVFCLT